MVFKMKSDWLVVDLPKEVVEPKLKPIQTVELVNFLPQDDLNYMLECINKGYEELEFSKELEKLGSGYFGTVFGYKNYAIKILRNADEDNSLVDGHILKELQHISSVLKLYAIVNNNAMITERVNGVTIYEYLDNGYQDYISPSYKEVYENDLKKILFAGWNADDLHNGNVMISKDTGLPVIVDVGFFNSIPKIDCKTYEEINLEDYGTTIRALRSSSQMDRYVSMKKEKELSKIKSTDNFHPMVIRELELNLHIA